MGDLFTIVSSCFNIHEKPINIPHFDSNTMPIYDSIDHTPETIHITKIVDIDASFNIELRLRHDFSQVERGGDGSIMKMKIIQFFLRRFQANFPQDVYQK